MVPQLIARVDGLPVSLLDREVVWPAPDAGRGRAASCRRGGAPGSSARPPCVHAVPAAGGGRRR